MIIQSMVVGPVGTNCYLLGDGAVLSCLPRAVPARRELARKLAQKYDGPAVDWAVEEMERLGYLDDEAFARTRAGMLLRKNRSRMVILQDLADKGVDRQLAETVLEELCSEEQEGDADPE